MAKLNGENRVTQKLKRFTLSEKLLFVNILISMIICGLLICK